MDRQVEFCQWYKDRLYKNLRSDGLFAELTFCTIGIELMLRQNEISMITWKQIDFDKKVIKDVKISKKLYQGQTDLLSYGDLVMSDNIWLALKHYQLQCGCDTEKLFPITNRGAYYDNIKKSVGDITFNGMRLRQIGITLKAAELKEVVI